MALNWGRVVLGGVFRALGNPLYTGGHTANQQAHQQTREPMPETEKKLPLRLWAHYAREYRAYGDPPGWIIITSETDAKSLYNTSSPTLVGEYVLVKATRGKLVQVAQEDDAPVI